LSLNFTPDALLEIVLALPHARRYLVAYSGGVDSHVLLHALAEKREALPGALAACYVDHGLSAKSGEWAVHCRRVCAELDVAFHAVEISAAAPAGESQEAWSRRLRYQALGGRLGEGEMLLTAHQADDQAETLLLQLLRGAGPAGLAAMPALGEFGAGRHARPLLAFTREALRDYARARGLSWIEDASNRDPRFDRNFLRHEILPRLARRWPALAVTLGRSAALQAEAAGLLEQLADRDMQTVYESASGTMVVDALRALPRARQRNLLRRWLRKCGLPVPDYRQLQAILDDVLVARPDAVPCVDWPGAEVRRYRGRLYAMPPLPEAGAARRWDLREKLSLPLGALQAMQRRGAGLKITLCPENSIQVRFRAGGETLRRPGRTHHQALKKLFQEHAIPTWQREYVPLLYANDKLVSVGGVWYDEGSLAAADEAGWEIEWTAADDVFGSES